MIITRTPFRITLGGGGTDLPSYYERHGGFVFSMTIDKYMYIMLHHLPATERKSIIRYSQVETVSQIEEIAHPLAREALVLHKLRDYIELTSMADMPAKTGLGSSGAYLVGLLHAIRAYQGKPISPEMLAHDACHIEMTVLKEPVGKQDQYMAAYGGFRTLEIDKAGAVKVGSVAVDFLTANELVNKARVYYTGIQRSATAVLKNQDQAARQDRAPDHQRVMDSLGRIKEIGYAIKKAFEERDLDAFGSLMHDHWEAKKAMSGRISLSVLDDLYERVRTDYGVLGGKIIGAGGGGFMMLYCPNKGRELDAFMASHDMPRISYFPSRQGSRVAADWSSYDDFDLQGA
jgi:D-glycero-alpha-D-manno-heptose-7-phosphate kinase